MDQCQLLFGFRTWTSQKMVDFITISHLSSYWNYRTFHIVLQTWSGLSILQPKSSTYFRRNFKVTRVFVVKIRLIQTKCAFWSFGPPISFPAITRFFSENLLFHRLYDVKYDYKLVTLIPQVTFKNQFQSFLLMC